MHWENISEEECREAITPITSQCEWIDISCSNSAGFDDINTIKRTIDHPSFHSFAVFAYRTREGYAIRTNPATRKKEMFVAGSRSMNDWLGNALDLLTVGQNRVHTQQRLAAIAGCQGVEVVYGHSRGGALVADMPLGPCIQKIGLNSAMVIAENKDLLNLNEDGSGNKGSEFDAQISLTGRQNVTVDFSPLKPHKVWRVEGEEGII